MSQVKASYHIMSESRVGRATPSPAQLFQMYKAFSPNCTLPPEEPVFVNSANIRGTMDILWTLLCIIILCTWSVLHLNVPPHFEPTNLRQKINMFLSSSAQKTGWMLVTFIAPEWILAKAAVDMYAAWVFGKHVKQQAHEDGVEWTMKHTMFANVGGFAVRFPRFSYAIGEKGDFSWLALHEAIMPENEWKKQCLNSMVPGGRDAAPEGRTTVRASAVFPCAAFPDLLGKALISSRIQASQAPGMVREDFNAVRQSAKEKKRDVVENEVPGPKDDENKSAGDFAPGIWFPKEAKPYIRDVDSKRDVTLRHEFHVVLCRIARRCSKLGELEWQPHQRHSLLARELIQQSSDLDSIQLMHSLLPLRGDHWVLDSWTLLEARRIGIISRLPSFRADELADHDKADLVAKLVAVLQVSWLVAQLCERAHFSQPSAPLEITTVAFAAVAFAIYACLLPAVQDVNTSIMLDAARSPANCEELRRVAAASPVPVGATDQQRVPMPWNLQPRSHHAIGNAVYHRRGLGRGREGSEGSEGSVMAKLIVAAIGGGNTVFGALHLLAWDAAFPSEGEKWLWRGCALYVTLLGVMVALELGVYTGVECVAKRFRLDRFCVSRVFMLLCNMFLWLQLGLFVLARLALLAEAFRSMYYLPPGVYVATGAAEEVPHVG